jgi:hypothetical protein
MRESASREFTAWINMRKRCYYTKHPRYNDWGGRGIRVCDQWKDDYSAFLADMGRCPDGKSLDRKDNDGDYTPDNCRWSTRQEQLRNRRKKDVCRLGHPLDMRGSNGYRRCRTCFLDYHRNYDRTRRR